MSESLLENSRLAPGSPASSSVLDLRDAAASDIALTGGKAANLATSLRAGLPVLPGFVITTQATATLTLPQTPAADHPVHVAWVRLSDGGRRPLAVRSSSVGEDSASSSMAGRFVSVLHVSGWDAFVDAVARVLASAGTTDLGEIPMAVLVQPMAEARLGGVLFGLDPLTGDRRRYLASLTDGLPDQIVGGAVTGTTVVLSRRGRMHSVAGPMPVRLGARHRHALARLAKRTAATFGAPQDMEWLIEPQGTLRLLQSRPITAAAVPPQSSHPLGPGPVAETFPDPLAPLERDLWERPLEEGLREALRISGAASKRSLEERFVVDVGGRLAVDLEALGVITTKPGFIGRLDPRPPARQLRAAWRIGRLRAALPAIVADAAAEVDTMLTEVPALADLGDRQLLTILDNAHRALIGLHAQEVLAGFFLDQRATSTTSASVAVATVAKARLDGLSDDEILVRHPTSLALLPPRIGEPRPLPATPLNVRMPSGDGDDPMILARESMRLRARWVQELQARTSLELGRRLVRREQLRRAHDVRQLSRERLDTVLDSLDIAAVVDNEQHEAPPLPAVFRLAADGSVVADATASAGETVGVSPGRSRGTVTHDRTHASGAVLVVTSLDPELASVLPDLTGLVAERGSPLSHLAILAREYRVPVVVGHREPLVDGSLVTVDGTAGTVETADAS